MKQGPIQFVGLDVHQSTIVVSVRDESGKVVMNATVARRRSSHWCAHGHACMWRSRRAPRRRGCTKDGAGSYFDLTDQHSVAPTRMRQRS